MIAPRRTEHSPIEVNGKKLFRVDVEERRSLTFFVLADDQAAAEADAKVLGEQTEAPDFDDVDLDVSVAPARSFPMDFQDVWTGGEKGHYTHWGELRE